MHLYSKVRFVMSPLKFSCDSVDSRLQSSAVLTPYRAKAIATSNNIKLVQWPLIGGLLYLVQ